MKLKPSYTPHDLQPTQTQNLNRYNRPMFDGSPREFDIAALVDVNAVAAIRKAFTTAKTSHEAWRSYKREGRFDRRAAPRATRGEQDVFRRKTGQSTTRVKAAVLIDASGSMRGGAEVAIGIPGTTGGRHGQRKVKVTRQEAASVFGGTIARALGNVPTIDLDVFQHSASQRPPHPEVALDPGHPGRRLQRRDREHRWWRERRRSRRRRGRLQDGP